MTCTASLCCAPDENYSAREGFTGIVPGAPGLPGAPCSCASVAQHLPSGGVPGQVLVKFSNTDFDVGWEYVDGGTN